MNTSTTPSLHPRLPRRLRFPRPPPSPSLRYASSPLGSFTHRRRHKPPCLSTIVASSSSSHHNDKNNEDYDDDNNSNNAKPNSQNYPSSAEESIGAEYGEGFLQFRFSGEKIRLDVDTLNERLQIQGADRIRHSMCPDEAFGLIFDWDDVIVDTRALQRAAWKTVAAAEGLPFPSIERPQMYDVRPERAAIHVLLWTRDMRRAQELAWLVGTEYARSLSDVTTALPGVVDWLSLMSKTNIPCVLSTSIDRTTITKLLEKLGIRQYFSALVTADDDMETIAQRYLSAAIKLNRPPNQCVVFTSTPAAIAAAHNCTMRAVALMGGHTAPQLRAADLTIGAMTELSVVNIRRLFANRGAEFMDLKKKRMSSPPRRRIRHATDNPPQS